MYDVMVKGDNIQSVGSEIRIVRYELSGKISFDHSMSIVP
jgi:hypothetical protein